MTNYAYQLVLQRDWKSPDGTEYNDPPKNFRSASMEEIATKQVVSMYNPTHIESRQIWVKSRDNLVRDSDHKNNGVIIVALLYWLPDGTGYAVENDYWGKKINYYLFGCEHKVKELSCDECNKRNIYHGGRCYHVYECGKCGDISSSDSSD